MQHSAGPFSGPHPLRILEDGIVRRIGSSTRLKVDVRVIAASNRDLRTAVEKGRFREDLYYRLAGIALFVPPLRERREDIAPLVDQFLNDPDCGSTKVAPDALAWLGRQPWRGNV